MNKPPKKTKVFIYFQSSLQTEKSNLITNEVDHMLKGLFLAAATEDPKALKIPNEDGLFTLKWVEPLNQ